MFGILAALQGLSPMGAGRPIYRIPDHMYTYLGEVGNAGEPRRQYGPVMHQATVQGRNVLSPTGTRLKTCRTWAQAKAWASRYNQTVG